MRLRHDNFKGMKINLRSGVTVLADADGCIDCESEQDAEIMKAAGWTPTAARAPRALPGITSGKDADAAGSDPTRKLWPGGPTRRQVEELRDMANEMNDKLGDAEREVTTLKGQLAEKDAEIVALKAAQGATTAPSHETPATPPAPASAPEAVSEGSTPARKPKGPKPDAETKG